MAPEPKVRLSVLEASAIYQHRAIAIVVPDRRVKGNSVGFEVMSAAPRDNPIPFPIFGAEAKDLDKGGLIDDSVRLQERVDDTDARGDTATPLSFVRLWPGLGRCSRSRPGRVTATSLDGSLPCPPDKSPPRPLPPGSLPRACWVGSLARHTSSDGPGRVGRVKEAKGHGASRRSKSSRYFCLVYFQNLRRGALRTCQVFFSRGYYYYQTPIYMRRHQDH